MHFRVLANIKALSLCVAIGGVSLPNHALAKISDNLRKLTMRAPTECMTFDENFLRGKYKLVEQKSDKKGSITSIFEFDQTTNIVFIKGPEIISCLLFSSSYDETVIEFIDGRRASDIYTDEHAVTVANGSGVNFRFLDIDDGVVWLQILYSQENDYVGVGYFLDKSEKSVDSQPKAEGSAQSKSVSQSSAPGIEDFAAITLESFSSGYFGLFIKNLKERLGAAITSELLQQPEQRSKWLYDEGFVREGSKITYKSPVNQPFSFESVPAAFSVSVQDRENCIAFARAKAFQTEAATNSALKQLKILNIDASEQQIPSLLEKSWTEYTLYLNNIITDDSLQTENDDGSITVELKGDEDIICQKAAQPINLSEKDPHKWTLFPKARSYCYKKINLTFSDNAYFERWLKAYNKIYSENCSGFVRQDKF